jgi:hypothetical protein
VKLTGLRTFIFSVVALGFLLAGLHLCLIYPVAGVAVFTAFAGAVVVIVGAVATKSTVGALADGTGLRGAMAALLTNAKPGDAAPPAAPPAPPAAP